MKKSKKNQSESWGKSSVNSKVKSTKKLGNIWYVALNINDNMGRFDYFLFDNGFPTYEIAKSCVDFYGMMRGYNMDYAALKLAEVNDGTTQWQFGDKSTFLITRNKKLYDNVCKEIENGDIRLHGNLMNK